MSLPAFLAPSSPPRSPHVVDASVSSYFRVQPTSSRPSLSLRPSRRDLILVLITLSFSYLLFSSPDNPTRSSEVVPVTPPSRYRLPDWSLWRSSHSSPSCSPASLAAAAGREKTFGESVKTYGVSRASVGEAPDELDVGQRGEYWDGGEESAEDDELEAISTLLKGYQPGWTIFERLYIYNGSFYVVT